jgi:Na+/H+-dicarboxylate symporter
MQLKSFTARENGAFNTLMIYLLMIVLGVVAGLDKLPYLKSIGLICGEFFINCFKCISMPVIFLSLVVTFINYRSTGVMQRLWRNTLKYTLGTTLFAAFLSCVLFKVISPRNMVVDSTVNNLKTPDLSQSYIDHLMHLIPTNFFQPFLENQVLTVLVLAVLVGAAIRNIPDHQARETVSSFFKGFHGILVVLTKWLLRWIPIGIFGFITTSVESMQTKHSLLGLGEYLMVIVLANLIQGLVVLPLWLKSKGFKPFQLFKAMSPALSVAFFSKSSVGTLPLTMDTVEQRLNISPEISRFVLPLCTSINMNGCAAFIFATVVYLMQNADIVLSPLALISWVLIATIAAIGNAGVPMGCFFLSLSLLVSMNVPIVLMGVILPFYSLIDMLETALNVWSDSCVLNVVAKECQD